MTEPDELFLDVEDFYLDEPEAVETRITITLTQPQLIELAHCLTGLSRNQLQVPQVFSFHIGLEQLSVGQWCIDDTALFLGGNQ
jgi:hypothetical protein